MNEKPFETPVYVKSGGLIEEIATLYDAIDFLDEWPKNRRGVIYETAVNACHRAHSGLFPISGAQKAFAGFAKSVGILEDVSVPPAWMTAKKPTRGGATA